MLPTEILCQQLDCIYMVEWSQSWSKLKSWATGLCRNNTGTSSSAVRFSKATLLQSQVFPVKHAPKLIPRSPWWCLPAHLPSSLSFTIPTPPTLKIGTKRRQQDYESSRSRCSALATLRFTVQPHRLPKPTDFGSTSMHSMSLLYNVS